MTSEETPLKDDRKSCKFSQVRAALTNAYALLIYAFIAGAFGTLAMPPYSIWPALIISLSVFYILLNASGTGALSFGLGWMFGFGYFLFGLSWIGNALLVEGNDYRWAYPLALCGLPILLALFPAIAAYIAGRADLKTLPGFLFFVGVFGAFEGLRGTMLTGFPWNLFGYSWAATLPMAQIVSLIGIYGLSVLTIAGFAVPAFIIVHRSKPSHVWFAGLILFCLFISGYIFGHQRLVNNPTTFDENIQIVLVQPNIPQDQKWGGASQVQNFLTHLRVTKNASLQTIGNITHKPEQTFIIWPESALNPYILEQKQSSDLITRTLKSFDGQTYLVTGVLRRDDTPDERQYYNSLVIIDDKGQIPDVYDKHHLVPFGEYIPFGDMVDMSPIVGFSGFQKGQESAILAPSTGPAFIPLICYEAIFPYMTQDIGGDKPKDKNTPRPEWMVNVTNDGWYGDTAGPYQHLAQASFRSIEQGLPLVRAANTGVSAIIDSLGRKIETIPYNTKGAIVQNLPQSYRKMSDQKTFYAKTNDWPVFFLLLILLFPHLYQSLRSRL